MSDQKIKVNKKRCIYKF